MRHGSSHDNTNEEGRQMTNYAELIVELREACKDRTRLGMDSYEKQSADALTDLTAEVAGKDKEIDRLSQLAMMREAENGDLQTELTEYNCNTKTGCKLIENVKAEVARLKQKLADAVEYLDEIYERTRIGGKAGGYPYGATTCLGFDVYMTVCKWRGESAEEDT